jgi:hypothetical protein
MWGFGIALMALVDFLSRRKHSSEKCEVCNKLFNSFEEKEEHRRLEHPDKELTP